MNAPRPREYGGQRAPIDFIGGVPSNRDAIKRGVLVGLFVGTPAIFRFNPCQIYAPTHRATNNDFVQILKESIIPHRLFTMATAVPIVVNSLIENRLPHNVPFDVNTVSFPRLQRLERYLQNAPSGSAILIGGNSRREAHREAASEVFTKLTDARLLLLEIEDATPANYDCQKISSKLNLLQSYIRSIYFPNTYPEGSCPLFTTIESAHAEAVGIEAVLRRKWKEVNSMIYAVYSQFQIDQYGPHADLVMRILGNDTFLM